MLQAALLRYTAGADTAQHQSTWTCSPMPSLRLQGKNMLPNHRASLCPDMAAEPAERSGIDIEAAALFKPSASRSHRARA